MSQRAAGLAIVPVNVPEVEEDVEVPPDWLPDGWVMEVQYGEDGAPYQVYILLYQSCTLTSLDRCILLAS
jgi:hypothetical protein